MIGHLYTLLLSPTQAPATVKGGGVTTRPRRTVQPSAGFAPDNTAALARARKRRRQQQFLTIHLLTQ